MNFHLDFQIPAFSKTIRYNDSLFFMGSCFAENIAGRMHSYKFNTLLNPHGILYNPESIASAIYRYIKKQTYVKQDLFYANDQYHSWEHHSRFSNPDAEVILSEINQQLTNAHQTLKTADWLFITFGSAYAYRHLESDKRIGNCHKQPQQHFEKELLTIDEMVTTYQQLIAELLTWNPKLKLIFTISPVRYIRDGIVENNRSKARLIELVHRLINGERILYFPAYELVMDDLRDYRFYKTDMVHPNEQAIEYVFEKFLQIALDQEAKTLFEKIKDIIKASAHRPLQENTSSHFQFKTTYLKRCKQLKAQYPFLQLEKELVHFSSDTN